LLKTKNINIKCMLLKTIGNLCITINSCEKIENLLSSVVHSAIEENKHCDQNNDCTPQYHAFRILSNVFLMNEQMNKILSVNMELIKLITDFMKKDSFMNSIATNCAENLFLTAPKVRQEKRKLIYEIEQKTNKLYEEENEKKRFKIPENYKFIFKNICSNNSCMNINRLGLKLCSGCDKAYYCSKECQLENWQLHKSDCNKNL
jgi:hypothetical protein